jgi:hypothetical protein
MNRQLTFTCAYLPPYSEDASLPAYNPLGFWIAYKEPTEAHIIVETLALATWATVLPENGGGSYRVPYISRTDHVFVYSVSDNHVFQLGPDKVGSLFNPAVSPVPCYFAYHARGFWTGSAWCGEGQAIDQETKSVTGNVSVFVGEIAAFCLECGIYNLGVVLQANREVDNHLERCGTLIRQGSEFGNYAQLDWSALNMDYLHKELSDEEPGKLSLSVSCWLAEQINSARKALTDEILKSDNRDIRFYYL